MVDFDTTVDTLVEDIKQDYLDYTTRLAKGQLSDINKEMIAEFNKGISYNKGSKYLKIVTGHSVWGFVVATDTDKKFRKGDILKAAGYNAPARNKARGNILDGGYTIRWTGPLYLK